MRLIRKSRMRSIIVAFLILLSLPGITVASNPGPPTVTSLFVPLNGEVTLSNGEVVTFSGEVHVLTQVVFSDTLVPTVGLFVNLVRVEGTSLSTGTTYLLVGATNTEVMSTNPGPPQIPEQTFTFNVISLDQKPGPPTFPPSPIVPIFLRNFVFAQEAGFEGNLQSVDASFVSD